MLLTKRTHKHKKCITEKNNDPIIEEKSISMERQTNEPKKNIEIYTSSISQYINVRKVL